MHKQRLANAAVLTVMHCTQCFTAGIMVWTCYAIVSGWAPDFPRASNYSFAFLIVF